MEELYEKLANKTLTIGEAIELGVHKANTASMKRNIGSFEKTLNDIGFSSDLPLSILEEESSIKKIAEQYDIEGGGEPFKETKSLWKRLEAAAREKDFAPTYLKEPFAHGKEQGFHQLTGDQRRKTKKMARVPEAKITFKGMLSAIAEIEDPQKKAAILANMFIPIRPGEIANLRLDEIDFVEVVRDDGSKVLTAEIVEYSRGTGGKPVKTRPFLEVQGPAAELLRHQANLAKKRGDNMLFVQTDAKGDVRQLTTSDMTNATGSATKPGPMSRFFNDNPQLQKVLGRKFQGVNDIRKFVPSIIARQLKYGAIADKIMGHAGANLAEGISEVGANHYISDIYYEGDVGPEGKAILANQHLIAEVNDIQTLNALPKAAGIDIPGYTDSNVITPVQKFKKEQNTAGDFLPRQATPEEIENSRLVTEEANEKLKAGIEEARKRGEKAGLEADKLKRERQEFLLSQTEFDDAVEEKKIRSSIQKQNLRKKIKSEEPDVSDEDVKKIKSKSGRNAHTRAKERANLKKNTVTGDSDMIGDNKPPSEFSIFDKIPGPVKKAIPIVGTAAALQAAATKGTEAKEAFEKGEYGTAALRGSQAVEEVLSPLPVTTGDVEEMYKSGRDTPSELRPGPLGFTGREITRQTREIRDASSQMDELMSK